jgi:hypothetical protein
MLIKWDAVRSRHIGLLALDITMLLVAVVNLLLLAFDFSYLTLRDVYIHHLPAVARSYDQVKGIEPHRFTSAYLQQAESLFRRYGQLTPAERTARQKALQALSVQMVEEDPFQRAQKSGDLELIKERLRTFAGVPNSSKRAFSSFWELTPETVDRRAEFFRSQITPVMVTNYWRRYDRSGRFVDHYVWIDIGFVTVFLVEFAIMWLRAIRRHGPDQRVLFPLYRWYDLVGCIPLQSLRLLRLIRIWAIYRRLVVSDLVSIGEGPVSRLIARYKNLISEEISDQVATRIMSDIQAKIRAGSGRLVIEQTLAPHKGDIQRVTIAALRKLEHRLLEERRPAWVAFLTDIVEQTVKQSPEIGKLRQLPLVSGQIERMTRRPNLEQMVDGALDTLAEAVRHALHEETGVAFVKGMVDDVLDEVIDLSHDHLVQSLVQSINLQLIEELKRDNAAVKRWRTGPLSWEPQAPELSL